MRRQTTMGAIGTTLVAVLALGACGAGGDDSSSAGDGGAQQAPAAERPDEDDAAADDAADAAAPAEGDTAESGVLNAAQSLTDREIIYTVDLTITTDDVPAAADQAAAMVAAAGGFVASEQVSGDDHATLTLSVPSDGHQETVTELEALGEVTDRSRSTEDVTQEVIDTASRIESQRASIARIRALLAEATALAEVVEIESELAGREADLDALLSRQEQLAGLTSMATVNLTLHAAGEEPPPEEDEDDGGFLWGLSGGWDALVTVGGGLLTVVGAALPFAVVAAVVAVPAYVVIRRRRGQAEPGGPAASEAPTA
ncbi:DUF4349 domain-containing protein [Jiangella asiatica]|uniref:DUF4349 domain-containing protein n=1 Tax=Jiangella asiatica TaxID=2530372 RepID=A0A4R5CDX2_9ACTN|nr:DUF4349 domain-containing protein [Jiangella asiatica]TDD98261.1 DUF4349 domain-containing protein [Jiangella asiatica]